MEFQVIKEGDLFLLTESTGDIGNELDKGNGLYTKDTRFLSKMDFLIDGEKPTLLSSTADKSYLASFRLMKDVKDQGAIELSRDRFISEGVLYERATLTNHFPVERQFEFSAAFDADFQDMFIVRKFRTGTVGKVTDREVNSDGMRISYLGADELVRETMISWDKEPVRVDESGEAHFFFKLAPKEEVAICFTIMPVLAKKEMETFSFEEGLQRLEKSYQEWGMQSTKIKSDMPAFDALYDRGVQDLRMLMTDVGHGDVPVAGLPWFAVPFGRDSLITSLFMLPLNPDSVKGTLRTLAAYQGTKVDTWRDEQPGKIMHEIRFGELTTTNQSPFTPYYGTVDSTPLFIVLLNEYFRWTGDLALVEELMPNVERALEWIDQFGGEDEAGFLTYHQEAEKGFPNQGWKDSSNSIVHQTGEYAKTPIALIEVQGYVYQAKKGLVEIYEKLGKQARAEQLDQEAEHFKAKVEAAFWMEDEGFYAIALDKDERKVHAVSSNPGHMLMSGLPEQTRASSVASRLVADDMFNGFGIRTLSKDAAGYYPMSYHNGSVWPHDNGMILIGLSRFGYKKEAEKVISSLIDASHSFEYQRLPELFCGHDKEIGQLVPYPTTCTPQAWSASTGVLFVQAMLGLHPDAANKKVAINPFLIAGMNELVAEDIRIGEGLLSLKITRQTGDEVSVEVLGNTTGYELTGTWK